MINQNIGYIRVYYGYDENYVMNEKYKFKLS